MEFYNKKFIAEHCQNILAFYNDRVIDSTGGYFQNYHNDGSLFNEKFRHLVSSARIVINYSTAGKFFKSKEYIDIARHGLAYVEQVHWQEESQRYAWLMDDHKPTDMTQQAYGYAFILMMYAAAKKAGLVTDEQQILKIYHLIEERFWQDDYGLYADEISSDGVLSTYRGQNSNMHMCEAMISCFEATQNPLYLKRAELIAFNIAKRQASLTDGLIWEHFTEKFEPDWEYNKDDPKNIYRPWGFQPGHQTEWSQLLVLINQYSPQTWLLDSAKELFDRAFDKSWDDKHGGLFYGFSPDGDICDSDKYFWVQSESIASAAMLLKATNDPKYLTFYQQLWEYSWKHFVDHKDGAWFWLLKADNSHYSKQKSVSGAKCDFHTIGACIKVLTSMGVATIDDLT
jgi:mannose/cellobiose epimerase-like protein (N-acyl-D-glucosamine 2-epimerase family)